MLSTLPSFSKALFCFYAALAFVHPFFVSPPNQWLMSGVSATTAILFLCLYFYIKKKGKSLTVRNIDILICIMVVLAVINVFIHLIHTQDMLQTTNIVFIWFALSAVGFSIHFFFLMLTFINCLWLLVVFVFDLVSQPTFIHFVFVMAIGSFVSGIMAITRYKVLRFSAIEIMRRKRVESKLRLANRQLNENANIDILTGLPNRRAYNTFLESKWNKMARLDAPISLIIADIDHFKQFNDLYGHQVGDEVLVIVGEKLQQCVRHSIDLVARFGGEEFVAITPNMSELESLQLAERMRKKISELNFKTKKITISLGIATVYPDSSSDYSTLFIKADKALYEAKNRGRNKVHQSQ
jgi:diguanylate cyclase (GGDEF)-like protein